MQNLLQKSSSPKIFSYICFHELIITVNIHHPTEAQVVGLKCQQKRSLLRDVQAVAVSVSFPVFRDYHLSLVQGAFTYLRWHWKVKSPVAHTASLVCVDYSKGPSRLVSPPHGQLMNGLHSLRPLPPLPVPWDTFGEGGCSAHIINLFVFFQDCSRVSH